MYLEIKNMPMRNCFNLVVNIIYKELEISGVGGEVSLLIRFI